MMVTPKVSDEEFENLIFWMKADLSLAIAEAEREYELGLHQENTDERRIYEFQLLAARSGQQNVFGEYAATGDRALMIDLEPHPNGILVTVYADSIQVQHDIRNTTATLSTVDGGVNYVFTFDATSEASFFLSDDPDTLASLQTGMKIEFR